MIYVYIEIFKVFMNKKIQGSSFETKMNNFGKINQT